ncbi:MAG: hypothetical protein B5766_08335 [Candidatus Lumbricidophila eiseniae]|uniref:Cell envelope-related transcriptional attenuator domain-containing protein n=1 Tax=Candidatus Lumbricidiphila eiseniae TaxID=1969409 RepID=A0A2A6FQM8_9MICO|nr:MAG: hypothetical protein B5766_08335 [Candidatus Lumbricidophila eiseniae]
MDDLVNITSRQSARNPGIARHGRLKRASFWRSATRQVSLVLAVILVSGAVVTAYALLDLVHTAKPSVTLGNEKVLEGVPDVGAIEGGVNLLIIGSDSAKGQGAAFGEGTDRTGVLNDVTILFHISRDHTNASVVSFPRDMLVPVEGCTDPAKPSRTLSALSGVKINTLLNYGGMPCVVKAVEQLTGVTIPFAGIVQFLGVAAMSTAVGGVPVCVATQLDDNYTDTHLSPGEHTLSGIDALQFLRTRHGVGDGSDLGRISNQQVFLSALARTLQSDGTLNDPVKLYSLAKAALSNMQLSDSLNDVTRLISIARALKDIPLDKIALVQYPTSYTQGGGAVKPNSSANLVNNALQGDVAIQLSPVSQENSPFGSKVGAAAPDPSASRAPTSTTAAPTTGAVAPTAPFTVAPTPETLPANVPGQSAAETRCSAGRPLRDQ